MNVSIQASRIAQSPAEGGEMDYIGSTNQTFQHFGRIGRRISITRFAIELSQAPRNYENYNPRCDKGPARALSPRYLEVIESLMTTLDRCRQRFALEDPERTESSLLFFVFQKIMSHILLTHGLSRPPIS